jgi:hypothetical protein
MPDNPAATQFQLREVHMRIIVYSAAMTAVSLALAGCGGGGGGERSAFGAPPTQNPSPTPSPTSSAVDIFQDPATQEFATAVTGDPLRIRYDAATNRYEVMAGSRGWETLVDDPSSSPLEGSPNTNFGLAGLAPNHSYFMIRAHYNHPAPEVRYRYSNLAAWGFLAPDGQSFMPSGTAAFGMATPAGSVPVSGNASYKGMVEGNSTVSGPWGWDGEMVNAWLGGSIQLNFDFGNGSLAGELRPFIDADKRYDLAPLAFANTVFGSGSQTFSGSFATAVSGPNSFSGLFTGPNGEEVIGKLAFPFHSPIDGATHSGKGAWIAKR